MPNYLRHIADQRVMGSAGIASELQRAIVDGEYQFNERLPAERELATRFGAARGTVREALRQLEQMRLVTRKVGSGTYVRYRSQPHDDVADTTSPLELIDVRLAVEPSMTRLAVLHANARDLAELKDTLDELEFAGTDPDAFSRADEHFHLALANCAQNPLLLWMYGQINEVRGHTQWSARKDKILTADRIRQYNAQHRELFDAIQSRDVDRAAHVIRAHLNKARQDLLGAESN